jgi:hypothetical protein
VTGNRSWDLQSVLESRATLLARQLLCGEPVQAHGIIATRHCACPAAEVGRCKGTGQECRAVETDILGQGAYPAGDGVRRIPSGLRKRPCCGWRRYWGIRLRPRSKRGWSRRAADRGGVEVLGKGGAAMGVPVCEKLETKRETEGIEKKTDGADGVAPAFSLQRAGTRSATHAATHTPARRALRPRWRTPACVTRRFVACE